MKQLHFLPGTQDQSPFLNPSAFTAVFWDSVCVCTRTRSPLEVTTKVTFSLKHAESNFEVDINISCISVPFLTSFSYFSPDQIPCDFPQIFFFSKFYVELRKGVSESISSWLLRASSSANDYFSST